MSCGVGCRHGSDPTLLWCRPTATALIEPLAWEPPYAAGAALKPKKKKRSYSSTGEVLKAQAAHEQERINLRPHIQKLTEEPDSIFMSVHFNF